MASLKKFSDIEIFKKYEMAKKEMERFITKGFFPGSKEEEDDIAEMNKKYHRAKPSVKETDKLAGEKVVEKAEETEHKVEEKKTTSTEKGVKSSRSRQKTVANKKRRVVLESSTESENEKEKADDKEKHDAEPNYVDEQRVKEHTIVTTTSSKGINIDPL